MATWHRTPYRKLILYATASARFNWIQLSGIYFQEPVLFVRQIWRTNLLFPPRLTRQALECLFDNCCWFQINIRAVIMPRLGTYIDYYASHKLKTDISSIQLAELCAIGSDKTRWPSCLYLFNVFFDREPTIIT